MRKSALLFALVLLALVFGIHKARAQAYESQSFTAVETTTIRGVDFKVPIVENGVIAVSDGGSLIARLKRSPFGNSNEVRTRWVINTRDKTNTLVDHGAKMLIAYPYQKYFEANLNKAGDHCDGSQAGQLEGFDVNLKESSGSSSGNSVQRKIWLAPKLGCFSIKEERIVNDATGKVLKVTVHTLTNIEVGEPDPSYFDTSLPEGYTDTKPEDYRGAVVNHKAAQ